jgi:hypothetical protein
VPKLRAIPSDRCLTPPGGTHPRYTRALGFLQGRPESLALWERRQSSSVLARVRCGAPRLPPLARLIISPHHSESRLRPEAAAVDQVAARRGGRRQAPHCAPLNVTQAAEEGSGAVLSRVPAPIHPSVRSRPFVHLRARGAPHKRGHAMKGVERDGLGVEAGLRDP